MHFPAITVCQPYAWLLFHDKLVENRTWPTKYRGPIAIHAGKSRDWMRPQDETNDQLVFGAVIGVARLVDVIPCPGRLAESYTLEDGTPLIDHAHAEGPYCWVLRDRHMLAEPFPATGARSIWSLKAKLLRFDTKGRDVTDLTGLWEESDVFRMVGEQSPSSIPLDHPGALFT